MFISELPLVMVRCLVLTILFETTSAFILKYRGKDLLIIILANIFTNPLVVSISVYFNYYYGLKGRSISLTILELFALISEGIIYKCSLSNKKINPFALSLILNMLSFMIGEILNKFIF